MYPLFGATVAVGWAQARPKPPSIVQPHTFAVPNPRAQTPKECGSVILTRDAAGVPSSAVYVGSYPNVLEVYYCYFIVAGSPKVRWFLKNLTGDTLCLRFRTRYEGAKTGKVEEYTSGRGDCTRCPYAYPGYIWALPHSIAPVHTASPVDLTLMMSEPLRYMHLEMLEIIRYTDCMR